MQVRALQRRVLELERGEGEDAAASTSEAGGSEDSEEGGGGSLEADLHRLLAHSRKAADEMKHYGQASCNVLIWCRDVREGNSNGRFRHLHSPAAQEAEELQREMRGLEEERAALLRDVALKEEAEQQYAKRGTLQASAQGWASRGATRERACGCDCIFDPLPPPLQAREIRDARSRIGTLERGMVQLAADYERQKVQLGQSLRAQLADAVTEQNGLRRCEGGGRGCVCVVMRGGGVDCV